MKPLHERLADIERQIADTAERLKDFPTHTYPCWPGDRCAACLARQWIAEARADLDRIYARQRGNT